MSSPNQSQFAYSDEMAHLQQSIGLGYFELYRESRILRFSEDVFISMGLAPSDDFQMSYDEYLLYLHPDDTDVVRNAIGEAIENNTSFEAEIRRRSKRNNAYKWVMIKGRPIIEEDGSCKVVVGISMDIKSSQRIEDDRNKATTWLNTIIEQTPDIIWAVDRGFNLLYYNSSFERSLKAFYDIDVHKHINMIDTFKKAGLQQLAQSFEDNYMAAFQGQSVTVEDVFEVIGVKIYAELTYSPIVINDRIEGVSVFSRDISDRKKAELESKILFKNIKESEELLVSSFNASTSGLFIYKAITDDRGEVTDFLLVSMNNAARKMLKSGFQDSVGKRLSQTAPRYWEVGLFQLMKGVFENGEMVEREITPDYGSREFISNWLEFSISKITDGVFINVRDVFDVRQRQIEMEEALQREQVLNEELAIREEELTSNEEELRQNLEYQSSLFEENQIRQANLMALINNTTEGICYLDKYGIMVECNEAYKTWLLRKKPDYLQDPCQVALLVDESYRLKFSAAINRALKGHNTFIIERSINRMKEPMVIEHRFFPVKSFLGEIIGVTLWSKDITEQEAARQVLEDNELRYRIVSKVTSDAMWDYDVANDKLTWFSGFNHYTELVSNEGESIQRWEQAVHPEDKERVLAAFRKFIKEDFPFEETYRLFKYNGDIMYVIDSGYAIRDENGKALRAIGGMRNITDVMNKQLELADINKKMGEYKLMALRSVMNPHFIFNSLNSIQYFITRNDRKNAINYLSYFSKLIRGILNSSVTKTIPLTEELDLLRYYTQLELVRFEDKFSVNFDIQDGLDIDNIHVPSLLVQPYVENSILHGLYNKESKGNLYIRCYQVASQDDVLYFEVEDDGIGRQAAQELREGTIGNHKSVGMMVTKERLEMINRIDTVSVEIEDKEVAGQSNGTKVIIKIQLEDF